MQAKYFNDGLVGNTKLKVSFTKNGELIRMLYNTPDYKQFIDTFHTGIKVNDSRLIYLHEDINNEYSQEYLKNTNILKTTIFNTYFRVRVTQLDFVPLTENVLVKKYKIKNENDYYLKINFLAYSKLFTNLNNDTAGLVKNDALIQYNHDYAVCIFSDKTLFSKQINGASNNFEEGVIGGKDYVGMSPDSAISYDLDVLAPGEEKEINIYIYVSDNSKCNLITTLDDEIKKIKKFDVEKLIIETEKYWNDYIKEHDLLQLNKKDINSKIINIYNRGILLLPLLVNEETGGISAGIEIDEYKTKCGRYSYCWPRDAVFITEAIDAIGMHDEIEKFYLDFCKRTQSKNGRWEQRFYTDGRLAPGWGYQIDETASVIFGVYAHYKVSKNKKFLKEALPMCEKAIAFLQSYVDDILSGDKKFQLSYDLWEEFEGESVYSLSAVFAAFSAMTKIYGEVREEIQNDEKKIYFIDEQILELGKAALDLKEYCINTFYDEERKSFVRNTKDRRMDISILGMVVPFRMLSPKDKKFVNTIEMMEMTLRTYTGGYIRYEGDNYVGNPNPWPIATLWMAWYYLEIGDTKKALENFSFVTNSASEHGFLGEQVDNSTMKPAWVIGLTWSHAMYLLILEKLIQKGLL